MTRNLHDEIVITPATATYRTSEGALSHSRGM